MKSMLAILIAAVVLIAANADIGSAEQYYWQQYQNYGAHSRPRAQPAKKTAVKPFSFRIAPDPQVYEKWNRYNRWLDYQQLQRSPLNPESDLDYMFRTF